MPCSQPEDRCCAAGGAFSLRASLLLSGLALASAPAPAPVAQYTPRSREITVTTVPLLVKEAERVYPFLEEEMAPGGVLENKEVYAFVPGTITVVEGDTVHFTFVNAEADLHSFVAADLAVSSPGGKLTRVTWVAKQPASSPFCAVCRRTFP